MSALVLCAALLASAAPAQSQSLPSQSLPSHASQSQPAATSAASELRDIRGPLPVPTWLRFLPWAGGAAAAGVLAALLLRRKQRKPATPSEHALSRLAAAWPLAEAGYPREYALGASDAVRWYIEDAFSLRAAHRTTEEFLAEAAAQPGSPLAGQPELSKFLEACDLAKFARSAPEASELAAVHELARGFVLATSNPQRSAS
jgi:hypothetical protein